MPVRNKTLSQRQLRDVAPLTEGGSPFGGTNDGDAPALGTNPAALTENSGAIGGTNDGNLPDLTTPSAALNAEAVREVAAKVNELAADVTNLIAAARELGTQINTVLDRTKKD